jgi:hypothetical protein
VSRPGQQEAVEALDAAYAAVGGVPPAALAFKKPGDGYTLGGLIPHNAGVVEHYRLVLHTIVDAGFAEVRPVDPPDF